MPRKNAPASCQSNSPLPGSAYKNRAARKGISTLYCESPVRRHANRREPGSGEEFLAGFQTLLLLRRAERRESGASRVECRSRRKLQSNQVIAILPGEDEVMLSAIEPAAYQRPPFVNRAAALAQINAGSLWSCLENIDGFSRPGCYRSRAVRAG